MVHAGDAAKALAVQLFGQAREFATAGAGAIRNATALARGRYLFRVVSGSCRVRSGGAAVVADATDTRFDAGDSFYLTAGDVAAEQFLSVIRVGAADVTLTVCGTDEVTSASQPSAWA